MKTFVVPVDGSEFAERALPVATELATRVRGRVLAVTSDGEEAPGFSEAYLAELSKRTKNIETMLVRDHDAPGAIEFAAHDGPERTVVMTSHGRGGLRWAMLGSVAEDVVHR